MKFTAKEDIEAPIEAVFDMVSDFESFERSALRRGADVQRCDDLAQKGVGMRWDAAFKLRGRTRRVDMRLTDFDRPNCLALHVDSNGLEGLFSLDLLALSRTRTRLAVDLELKPKSLSGRLFLQSLKLARGNLVKKFKLRVSEYAKEMENRYKTAG